MVSNEEGEDSGRRPTIGNSESYARRLSRFQVTTLPELRFRALLSAGAQEVHLTTLPRVHDEPQRDVRGVLLHPTE